MDATTSSNTRPPPRRPVQACSACKKSKVRCEIIELLDLDRDIKCHRCSVLGHPCSFSEMDKSLFISYVASPPPKLPDFPEDLRNKEHPFVKFVLDKEAAAIAPPAMGFGIGAVDEFGERVASSLESNFWSYFKDSLLFDWSTPLSTIRELLKPTADSNPSRHSPPHSVALDSALSNILSRGQIDELLEAFAVRYMPWLSFSLVRDSDGTVLELACCNVASRHLSPNFRSLVSARLQKLTENTIAKLIFNNSQSLEAVQALIILALWCPPGSTDSGMWDARVLIASAVSIGMTLRLNEASGKVIELKRTGAQEPAQLVTMTNKARLWTALTLTESMLCLGSGRTPLACRSPSDVEFIPMSVASPDTLTECRDCRLRFLGEILNACETAAKIHLNGQNPTDIDNWYDAKMKVLGTLDRLRRLILPLEVLSDYDKFHFHMLLMILHSCRLQILYSSLYEARAVYNQPGSGGPSWFIEFKPHGMNAVTTWGRESLQLAEAILVAMLQTDVQCLSSCPDVVFCMVAFAADMVFAVKRFIFQIFAVQMIGSMDKLLKKSMQHLSAAAPSEDHPASGAARVISAMLTTTDDFVKHGMAPPPLFHASRPFMVHLQEQQHHSEVPTQPPMDLDFQNTDFWTQFVGYDLPNNLQS